MQLRMYGATDKGLVRSQNQDAYFCDAEKGIAILADGMGGHQAGEVASALVVSGVLENLKKNEKIFVESLGNTVEKVLQHVNKHIYDKATSRDELRGMGATVNVLQFLGSFVVVGHVGDSRTYLIRPFKALSGERVCGMWQITVDHNVGTFVDRGIIVKGRHISHKPLNSSQKAQLTRGMGVVSDLKTDLYSLRVFEGDVLLTCSDGLHNILADAQILATVLENELEDVPHKLIAKVLALGAPDNVTVIVSAVSYAQQKPDKPQFQMKTPRCYLVRQPSGEIIGPLDSQDVLKGMDTGVIDAASEICSHSNRWCFANQKSLFLKLYPEFDSEAYQSFLNKHKANTASLKSVFRSFFQRLLGCMPIIFLTLGSLLAMSVDVLVLLHS